MGKIARINEIIDNESSFKKTSMSMTMTKTAKSKLCSDAEAESGASRYIKIFDAPECKLFFLKVMYHLPYDERERLREAAQKSWVKNPKKYFAYSAKKALAKYGY